ncbi:hypothetical protein [Nonomuraea rhodomycinica]|uniref:Uncharacterized protein n=1 Tax=Nonomuraea rhodomycinica TaxID=1712872 RepID=A0A7Y6IN07_9ACTN|nr:hypothetical protein [Nonomuraea rhodomycinica]NUW39894.1 hypothetical protein [Nonomuraea rhodomycinica]
MADISYLDAWGMWLDGRSALGHDLLGLPVIWWGRFGKILSFVSGATVVVDLVGPEKLSRYGERLARFMARRPSRKTFVVGLLTGGAVIVVTEPIGVPWPVEFVLGSTLGGAAGMLSFRLGCTLQRPDFPVAMRWVSLGLFVVGFHFDLLAS